MIVYDFGTLSSEESINGLEALLKEELKGLDVSILANNVGTTKYGLFHEATW